jgi:hypothetical protein
VSVTPDGVSDVDQGFALHEAIQIVEKYIRAQPVIVFVGDHTGVVGCDVEVLHIPQRTVGWQGFFGKHVALGSTHMPTLECRHQRVLVDHTAARHVVEHDARSHGGKGGIINHATCLVGQRRYHDHIV